MKNQEARQTLPLVSVIVPCYNHEQYIKQCIESIYKQTYKNFELIVIDDGSKDKSPEILEKLSKTYGFYYEHQKNVGISATLNKGIGLSKGKYITDIASDDLMLPSRIEVLVDTMEKLDDSYAMVAGNAEFIDNNGHKTTLIRHSQHFSTFIESFTSNRTDIDKDSNFGEYATLLRGNYIPATSILFRKDALVDVGLFTKNVPIEDWDIYLKLSKKYKMKYTNQVLALYRQHDTNTVKINALGLIISTIEILQREREYCIQNNYFDIWLKMYGSQLKELLLSKQYRLFAMYFEFKYLFKLFILTLGKFKRSILNMM